MRPESFARAARGGRPRRRWIGVATLIVAFAATSARAQDVRWLPPDAVVRDVIERHPAIVAALARRDASRLRADAIQAAPYETTIRSYARERSVREVHERYRESEVTLERPLRFADKRDADRALAQSSRDEAEIAYADARHELSRALLRAWFELLAARAELVAATTASEQARAFADSVTARLRRGDASQLEDDLARADLQRQRAAVDLARAGYDTALALFSARFPGVPVDEAAIDAPLPLADGERGELRRRYVEESHERRLAQAEAERAGATARRAQLDRRPDPTVGVFLGVDRGGMERIAGVSVSVPIPGAYRSLSAEASRLDTEAVRARADEIAQRVGGEFDALWAGAFSRRSAASAMREAARTQGQGLSRVERGYALGELGIADVLAARRAYREAVLVAQRAQLDAAETMLRLELDLHRLWDFD